MTEPDVPAAEEDPFAGFEVTVLADRPIYAPGDTVRFTVTATNGPRPAEHHYPGWLRFDLTVRDDHHRPVAALLADAADDGGFTDRWLPGQMQLTPVYWSQGRGPVVPAWAAEPAGPRVPPGRYRARVSWLGRPPGGWVQLPEVHSPWFELV